MNKKFKTILSRLMISTLTSVSLLNISTFKATTYAANTEKILSISRTTDDSSATFTGFKWTGDPYDVSRGYGPTTHKRYGTWFEFDTLSGSDAIRRYVYLGTGGALNYYIYDCKPIDRTALSACMPIKTFPNYKYEVSFKYDAYTAQYKSTLPNEFIYSVVSSKGRDVQKVINIGAGKSGLEKFNFIGSGDTVALNAALHLKNLRGTHMQSYMYVTPKLLCKTIPEKYQKLDGTSIKNDSLTTLADNEAAYNKTAPKIQNYVAVNAEVNGDPTNSTTVTINDLEVYNNVKFIYKDDKNNNGIPDDEEKSYKITEKYQRPSGNNYVNIQNDTVTTISESKTYTKDAPPLKYYILTEILVDGVSQGTKQVNIPNVKGDHEVIFRYIKQVIN